MFYMANDNPKPRRMRLARLLRGLTQREVAEESGIAENSISRYESGSRVPKAASLRMLAHVYSKPVEWFYDEEEEPQAHTEHLDAEAPDSPATAGSPSVIGSLAQVRQEFSARFDRLETYIRAQAPVQAIAESRTDYGPSNYEPSDRSPVRLTEVASAAGVGAEVYDETPVGLLWFRNDWLQSHSIDPEQSNIISVRGASMEPTLLDGCSILVDRKRREPHEDRIYVMRTEEGLVVKRLGLDEEDRWELRSDNPDWRATPMSPEAEVVGEVRWTARTF